MKNKEENVNNVVENKEYDYLKKYNQKYNGLKTILSFIFIVVAIFIAFVLINFIYENKVILDSKQAILDLANEDNLYISVINKQSSSAIYAGAANYKIDYYIKGNTIRNVNYILKANGSEEYKGESYETIGKNRFAINKENKTYQETLLNVNKDNFEGLIKNIFSYDDMQKLHNGRFDLTLSILLKNNYLGYDDCNLVTLVNKYYDGAILSDFGYSGIKYDCKMLINKSTNLPVKIIRITNQFENFSYTKQTIFVQKGIVTDEDVTLPDLADYTIVDQL